jgi:response regulator RpfG family c-di-GMP phosphodiesterase
LAVDDEYEILDIIRLWLQMDGFAVCTFTNPLAALEHFISYSKNHDIVISDIRMSDMNGYEFVKQVKKINPRVKIILMSYFEIEDKELVNDLPYLKIDGFIKKPFSRKILRNIINLGIV